MKHLLAICVYLQMWKGKDSAKSPSLSQKPWFLCKKLHDTRHKQKRRNTSSQIDQFPQIVLLLNSRVDTFNKWVANNNWIPTWCAKNPGLPGGNVDRRNCIAKKEFWRGINTFSPSFYRKMDLGNVNWITLEICDQIYWTAVYKKALWLKSQAVLNAAERQL